MALCRTPTLALNSLVEWPGGITCAGLLCFNRRIGSAAPQHRMLVDSLDSSFAVAAGARRKPHVPCGADLGGRSIARSSRRCMLAMIHGA